MEVNTRLNALDMKVEDMKYSIVQFTFNGKEYCGTIDVGDKYRPAMDRIYREHASEVTATTKPVTTTTVAKTAPVTTIDSKAVNVTSANVTQKIPMGILLGSAGYCRIDKKVMMLYESQRGGMAVHSMGWNLPPPVTVSIVETVAGCYER